MLLASSGISGSSLPSSSASGKRREREEGERDCRLRLLHEFTRRRRGRVRDCWISENVREFYFPDEGRVPACRRGGRLPGRTVNVNKERTHFFLHYFPPRFRTRDTSRDIDQMTIKREGSLFFSPLPPSLSAHFLSLACDDIN